MADDQKKQQRKWVERISRATSLNYTQLAKKAGVSSTTLTRFMNDQEHKHSLSHKTIIALEKATGIIFSSAENGLASTKPATPTGLSPADWTGAGLLPVPIYDIRASAGAGALVEDAPPMDFQPFKPEQLERLTRTNSDNLAVITVSGDSMWETLHDGDNVLVDRSINRVVREGIYILLFEEELLVKRCQRNLETGGLMIISDNPAYPMQEVNNIDNFKVLGRVVWIGRALG